MLLMSTILIVECMIIVERSLLELLMVLNQ